MASKVCQPSKGWQPYFMNIELNKTSKFFLYREPMGNTTQPNNFSRREVLKLGLGLSISPFLISPALAGNNYLFVNTNSFHLPGEVDKPINKRPIPVSGEMIPVIGLGTWRTFDAGNSKEKRMALLEVLKTLVAKGASIIDSSPMYGSSETVVGDLSQQLNIRSKLFLATKVWISGKEEGIQQMNESFQKMKTEKMDLMQVHNLVDVNSHLKTLRAWKDQGKIRYFGITHYVPSVYPELIRLIKTEKPDFVQFCYNIATRDAEKKLLPLAKEKGIAVLINRPFEEGNLFNVVKGHPLPPWAKEYDITSWAQFFLKFIISHPAVTCTIPGTSKALHLEENIGAGTGKLPDEKTRNKMADYFKAI
jgi:diketogulonate reductase-like aldo/keto reductase